MSDGLISRKTAAVQLRGRRVGTAVMALVATLACVALGACGADGDTGGQAVTTSSEQAAYPVTIRSRHGSATIDEPPRRVVTLDNQATDDALALGVLPVGIVKVTYVPGDMQTWTKAALGSRPLPQLIDTTDGIPYERVAALRPDLILATNAFELENKATYNRLSRIAPTVHFTRSSLSDSWQEVMQRIGQALGQRERADELVAAAERDLAAVRKRTPELVGKTVNFFNADPSGLYTINASEDYSIRFLEGLGLRLSPKVAKLKGEGGRAVVSAERYDVLDSDLLMGTSVSPKALTALRRDKLFNSMKAVREGRYVALDIGPATAMAFPSVLSVPYATAEVVPKLEQAITAGE
jgi:iron complex transport system substrate-binding protein